MAALSWAVFIFALAIPQASLASGVLEFHMISFSSNCQEPWGDACDHYLTFCFDKATNSPNIGSCAYTRQETGVHSDTNDVTFGSNMKGVSNPIIVPIQNFSDPRVLLVMRSMDKDDTSADDLVVIVSTVLTLYPSNSRSRASYRKDTASLDGNTFVYEYMAYCDSNFYGPQCTVFCQAQTDTSGHQYLCDADTGAKIECQTGWDGANCADDTNECLTDPNICSLGNCVNYLGYYRCVCPAGLMGSNCEQDIDECENNASNPCLNEGICINIIGSYRCECRTGWTGVSCAVDIDECVFKPCAAAGAACVNLRGSYKCVCPDGALEISDGLLISDCIDTSVRDNQEVKQETFLYWPIIVAITGLLLIVIVIVVAIVIVCVRKRRKESKRVLGRSPSQVVVEEGHVYNHVDEPGSSSPLDSHEQQRKKDKTGGEASGLDNAGVPHLDSPSPEVKDNTYEDFSSLKQNVRQLRKLPTAPVYEKQPVAASGQHGAGIGAARKVPIVPEGMPEESRKVPTAPVYEKLPIAASGQHGAGASGKVPIVPEGMPEESRKVPTAPVYEKLPIAASGQHGPGEARKVSIVPEGIPEELRKKAKFNEQENQYDNNVYVNTRGNQCY